MRIEIRNSSSSFLTRHAAIFRCISTFFGHNDDSWACMQFFSLSEQLTRISQCLFVLNSFGLIQWIANNNSSLFYKKKGYYKWWFLMQGLFTLKGIESLPVLALMPWAEQHPSKLQFTPTRTNFNSFIKMFWIIRSCITLEGWLPPLFLLVSIPHISALIGGWGQVARGNIESRSYWFNIKSDLNPRAHWHIGDLIISKHSYLTPSSFKEIKHLFWLEMLTNKCTS